MNRAPKHESIGHKKHLLRNHFGGGLHFHHATFCSGEKKLMFQHFWHRHANYVHRIYSNTLIKAGFSFQME